jgi:dTDP-4-dehydrorhamnose 3,5-epimerase
MPFIKTEFNGLLIFEPNVFEDARGYFFESYNLNNFIGAGAAMAFVQDNQAKSQYGVIRGLHYQQAPHAQTKLIRALQGRILDVVVDLRKAEPTFGKVFCLELSDENKKQLLVPQGFAHGYSVLSETAEVMYKCDNFYFKAAEGGILYNDPALNIDWKIEPGKELISDKDLILPTFENCANTF